MLLDTKHEKEKKRDQASCKQFGVGAAPINYDQEVRVDGVEDSRERGVSSIEPSSRQQKHGEPRRGEREPDVRAWGHLPGQEGSENRAENPGDRWVEQEA